MKCPATATIPTDFYFGELFFYHCTECGKHGALRVVMPCGNKAKPRGSCAEHHVIGHLSRDKNVCARSYCAFNEILAPAAEKCDLLHVFLRAYRLRAGGRKHLCHFLAKFAEGHGRRERAYSAKLLSGGTERNCIFNAELLCKRVVNAAVRGMIASVSHLVEVVA